MMLPVRGSQSINCAAVAEHSLHHVVDMVQLDRVVMAAVGGVVPVPADRHAGVEQIVDLVMRNGIVARLGDPDADTRRVDMPAVKNVVIVNRVVARFQEIGRGHLHFAHSHSADTEIEDSVLRHAALLAAAAKPNAVVPEVRKFAFLDRAVPSTVGHHSRGNGNHRLTVAVPLRLQTPVFMAEGESSQDNVLDKLLLLPGLTVEFDQACQPRGDNFGLVHIFAGHRQILQGPGRTIHIPLAR